MDLYVTVRRDFSAGHRDALCGPRHHGHTYTVEAQAAIEDYPALVAGMAAFVTEIDNREMEEQFPGVPPTGIGLAAYLHERLRLTVPSISMVRVGTGDVMWGTRDG
jgi:6-pyruvoyl-tetrahydropterin synthase